MWSVFRWKAWLHCWKAVEFLQTHFPNTNEWTSTQAEERAHAEQNHQQNAEPVDTDHIQTAWSHTVLMAMILAASEQNIFVHLGFHQWQLKIWQSIHAAPSHPEYLVCNGLPLWTWKIRGRLELSSEFRLLLGHSNNSRTKDPGFEGNINTKFNLFPAGDNNLKAPTFPNLRYPERISPHGIHWI